MISLTKEIGNNLIVANTSKEAWITLATLFDSQTTTQEDFLDQQWCDIKKNSTLMLDYLNSVKRLAHQFEQIGKSKICCTTNRAIVTGLGCN